MSKAKAGKLTITIPAELEARLEPFRGSFNISGHLASALEEKVTEFEKTAAAGQAAQGHMAVLRYARDFPLVVSSELQSTGTIAIPSDIERSIKSLRSYEEKGFRSGWASGIDTIKSLMSAGVGVQHWPK